MSVKLCHDFEDISRKTGVVLDQGPKKPLFITGSFYNINSFENLGSYFFEIDSGSDRIMINRKICKELNLTIEAFEVPRTVVGLNGLPVLCLNYVLFRFEMDSMSGRKVSLNLIGYVCEANIPPLLGNDVFGHNKCVIDYDACNIIVKTQTIPLFETRETALENCKNVLSSGLQIDEIGDPLGTFTVKNTTKFNPKELAKVEINVDEEIFYDRRVKPPFVLFLVGHLNDDYSVLDMKVQEVMSDCYILVRNLSNRELILKKDTELGFICTSLNDRPMSLKVSTESNSPIDVRSIQQRRKLSPSDFDEVMERGVCIEPGFQEEILEHDYHIPEAKIVEKDEYEKHKNVDRWEKQELLKQLKIEDTYNEMVGEIGEKEAKSFKEKLENLAWDLRGIFSLGTWSDLDKPMDIPPIRLQVVDNCPDLISKYRHMSPKKREVLDGIMTKLLAAGIVRKSTGLSRFASCPHLVLEEKLVADKPVVKFRFTIDYRKINEYLKGESYKLKLIAPILEEVANTGRVFSTCDAASYFWQFPLDAASQELTAFYYNELVYCWNRAAQGLKVIPSWAQRISDGILEGGKVDKYVKAFVDDFLTWALTYFKGFENLKQFLLTCSYYNVKLSPKKCSFMRLSQTILGYRVGYKKIERLLPSTMEKLQNFPSPTNKSELRSLLGLLAWYQSRSNLKDQYHSLREMAKINARFRWEDKHEKELRACLKILLEPNTNCLRPPIGPTNETHYVVFTDSSSHTFGALLCQFQHVTQEEVERDKVEKNAKRLYLLEYFSRVIDERDRLMPIAVLELFALDKCLKFWHSYLYGGPKFLIMSDSVVISYWLSLRLINERVARAIFNISQYDFLIQFIPSTLNGSDVFSRVDLDIKQRVITSDATIGTQNYFKTAKIFNSDGIPISNDSLFSPKLRDETDDFFKNSYKGRKVIIESPQDQSEEGEGTHLWNGDVNSASVYACQSRLKGRCPGDQEVFGPLSPLKSMSFSGSSTSSLSPLKSMSFSGSSTSSFVSLTSKPPQHLPHDADISSFRCDAHSTSLTREEAGGRIETPSDLNEGSGREVREAPKEGSGRDARDENSSAPKEGLGRDEAPTILPVAMGRGVLPMKRIAARRRRKLNKNLQEKQDDKILLADCKECKCEGLGTDVIDHCTCCCDELIKYFTIDRSLHLSTEEQLAGIKVLEINNELNFETPNLEEDLKLKILDLQKESELVILCKTWLEDENSQPDAMQALGLNAEQLSVLNQISLFRIGDDGIIYRMFVDKNGSVEPLIFLANEPMTSILKDLHESKGHLGSNKLFILASKNYYCPNLRLRAKQVVDGCLACIKYSYKVSPKERLSTQLASQANRKWSLDHKGPLPVSNSFRYILVARCNATNSTFLRPAKTTSGTETAEILVDIFLSEGIPELVAVDGQCLTQRGLDSEILKKMGVKIQMSNYLPRAQSKAERAIKTLTLQLLKEMSEDSHLDQWHKFLPKIQLNLNYTPSVALGGYSPLQLTRRHHFRTSIHILNPMGRVNRAVQDFNELVRVYDNIRAAALYSLMQHKNFFSPKEALIAGQIVFRRKMCFSRNMSYKLQVKVTSAYEVVDRIATGLYRLKDIRTDEPIILPIDQLVRTSLTREQMLDVLRRLEEEEG